MGMKLKDKGCVRDSDEWLYLISPIIRGSGQESKVMYETSHGKTLPGWTEPPRYIYDHELVLFRDAEHIMVIDGERIICPPDSFLIVPPGKIHSSANNSKSVGVRCWSHFDWIYSGPHGDTPLMTFLPSNPVPQLFRLAPAFVPDGILRGHIKSPSMVYGAFERMFFLLKDPSPALQMAARAVLLEILTLLCRRPEGDGNTPKRAHKRMASVVRHAIERACHDGANFKGIKHLLRSQGMSYEHLCRTFRKEYGITPISYLNALRIGRARLLLGEDGLSVSEIAYKVGFEKVSYFIQLFRQTTGVTPSEFRKSDCGAMSSRRGR